jgi:crotonobetainyl-CoA:carnitine CoA-transferase CaiB-like acyl-CoA transferase
MADGVLAHAVMPLAALNQDGQVPATGQGTLTGALACYGIYRTADGRHVAVGALERKFWDALCRRLERGDLAPLHRTGDADIEARVRRELGAIFLSRPLAHWSALFAQGESCVTPVLRLDEALDHPHFQARAMSLLTADGVHRQFGQPVKMSGFEPAAPRAAPHPGEHTDEVLREAGFTERELADLRAAGAVG